MLVREPSTPKTALSVFNHHIRPASHHFDSLFLQCYHGLSFESVLEFLSQFTSPSSIFLLSIMSPWGRRLHRAFFLSVGSFILPVTSQGIASPAPSKPSGRSALDNMPITPSQSPPPSESNLETADLHIPDDYVQHTLASIPEAPPIQLNSIHRDSIHQRERYRCCYLG